MANDPAVQDAAPASKFTVTPPAGPTDQQILQDLGYNPGKNGERLPDALTGFGREHGGITTDDKLQAVYAETVREKKAFHEFAPNITLAQTHAILVASQETHVPPETIARLAAGQRAFDPTYKAYQGRQPGMIQMSDNDWLKTVQAHGDQFPRTKELAAEMNAPGPDGKPLPATALSDDLKSDVLALRSNPVIAAEIGTEYAKRNPVQLDTINAYMHETPSNKAQSRQLENFFSTQGGISHFDPSITYTEKEPDGKGGTVTRTRESNPWCAAMVNSVLASSGFKESNGGDMVAAADFMKYGKSVDPRKGGVVKPGDVVMFLDKTGAAHHVAVVKAVNPDGTFSWVGGNQSSSPGKVTEDSGASLRSGRVLFREPPPNAFAVAETQYQATLKAEHAPAVAVPPAAGAAQLKASPKATGAP